MVCQQKLVVCTTHPLSTSIIGRSPSGGVAHELLQISEWRCTWLIGLAKPPGNNAIDRADRPTRPIHYLTPTPDRYSHIQCCFRMCFFERGLMWASSTYSRLRLLSHFLKPCTDGSNVNECTGKPFTGGCFDGGLWPVPSHCPFASTTSDNSDRICCGRSCLQTTDCCE